MLRCCYCYPSTDSEGSTAPTQRLGDAKAREKFGSSVAVSGDTAVVGAHQEDAGGSDAGAAYVLQRDQGGADNWGEVREAHRLRRRGPTTGSAAAWRSAASV